MYAHKTGEHFIFDAGHLACVPLLTARRRYRSNNIIQTRRLAREWPGDARDFASYKLH